MKVLCFYGKLFVSLSLGLFAACATLPSLDVTYKTMPKSSILEGREIYFKVIDKRTNKDIIGPGAKKVYKNFAGNIAFIVDKGAKEKSTVGIYEVQPLFKNAFVIYFENMGLRLLPEPKAGIPQLAVNIYDFVLDLSGSSWTARIVYGAEFSQHGKVLIRKFQGEGEKIRVTGLTQAHQVMSETFSDIVNQLNVRELFSPSIK